MKFGKRDFTNSNVIFAALMAVLLGVLVWALLGRAGVVQGPPSIPASKLLPTSEGTPKHKLAYLSRDDPSIGVDDLGVRKWKIINVHEHLKGEVEAQMLITMMDKLGIKRTALMASTTYTLTLNPIYGFEGFKDNNESIIAVKKKWPDRFAAFITLNPLDEGNLELVKDYVSRGADGIKLYVGHGASTPKFAFHSMPINDPRLEPVFAYAEETQLPIVLHVNLEKFWDEMLDLLEKHPYLRVNMPHFGLHKNTEPRLKRLAFLLERYPNVYTDVSFGFYTFQLDGFEVLAKNRSRSRTFMTEHKNKVLFASDMVLEPTKDMPYIENTLRSYMQFLEKERWRFNLVPSKTMHGMGLDDDTLHHIYEVAPANFLMLDANGNLVDRTKVNPGEGMKRPPLPKLTADMIPVLKKGEPSKLPGGPAPSSSAVPAGDDGDTDADGKQGGCEREPPGDDG